MSGYRISKALGSLLVRMMQSSSQRADETLIMERARLCANACEHANREKQELMKEIWHPVRTREAKTAKMKGSGVQQSQGRQGGWLPQPAIKGVFIHNKKQKISMPERGWVFCCCCCFPRPEATPAP